MEDREGRDPRMDVCLACNRSMWVYDFVIEDGGARHEIESTCKLCCEQIVKNRDYL